MLSMRQETKFPFSFPFSSIALSAVRGISMTFGKELDCNILILFLTSAKRPKVL